MVENSQSILKLIVICFDFFNKTQLKKKLIELFACWEKYVSFIESLNSFKVPSLLLFYVTVLHRHSWSACSYTCFEILMLFYVKLLSSNYFQNVLKLIVENSQNILKTYWTFCKLRKICFFHWIFEFIQSSIFVVVFVTVLHRHSWSACSYTCFDILIYP